MIYNSFVAVIDGPDACGKGTVLNELSKNLYHKTPEDNRKYIYLLSSRPATRLVTVDKDKTNDYDNNMYEYMDAYLLGRFCNTSLTSIGFEARRLRKPIVKINDRGLLSTFFYAYVHDDGGYDYAKKIRELSGEKPKTKKSQSVAESPATIEEISNRLIRRYIKFEGVIRERLKVLLNSTEKRKLQFKYASCSYYDEAVKIESVDVGALMEVLHTDMTIAICCDESLSDKVIARRHSLQDDSNQFEQIFETNETFRKNVNLIYNFFMRYCLPKLDDIGYVNPFIGHIIKVYTTKTINGVTNWRKPVDINRDILSWWNYYLRTNNFTELGYEGHEEYRFMTCQDYPSMEEN